MKTAGTLLVLLFAATALSMVPTAAFAQAMADSVFLYANPPAPGGPVQTIDQQIMADTLTGGVLPPNTVFVLQQTGTVDTVFFIAAPIHISGNLTIVGKTDPATGHPPVLAPYTASDNTSPWTFFYPNGHDTVRIENLYCLGTRIDGSSVSGQVFYSNGDSTTFIANHCVFENFSSGGTPNIAGFWNTQHGNIDITNCEFRNNQDDQPQNPGFTWVDPGTYPCDTARFVNNTFFIMGGSVIGSAGYVKYLDFEHNTVFFTTKGGIFAVPQLTNAVIKNNIFYSAVSAGMDTAHANAADWGTDILQLDTLSTLKSSPFNLTEKGRSIVVTNNAYFWPQAIIANWTKLNTAADTMYGKILPPTFVTPHPASMLTDKTTWPGINISSNDSTDPGFNASLVQQVADSMARFVDTCWKAGGGLGTRPYVFASSDPPTWVGVASNWAATQGYPVPENLRYSATLTGDDGKPLGDLNWFPEYLSVHQTPKMIPTTFSLSQNYPNPFNPSTDIRVSLSHGGEMSLTIYNVLGQVVQVVDQGSRPAGEYTYNVNMDNFASGVYFYTLRQGAISITKKMLLLK